jgi:hypothetical protein
MKKIKNLFAVVLAVFLYGGVLASGNLRVNVTTLSNDLTEVEILDSKSNVFEIYVKNDQGEVVFSKDTKSPAENYKRVYDFSKLENGTYFLTVAIDKESKETKFEMVNGKMNVVKQKKAVDPVFIFDNNQLKLSYLNFEGENTNLTIYDNKRNVVYQKNLSSDFVTHHGLDFSKSARGSYQAILSSGLEYYSYNIVVD